MAGVLLNMLSKFWRYPDPAVGYRAGLGFWFYRASAAHSNRTEQLDAIEAEHPLAADEIEALRDRNAAGLPADRFAEVAADAARALGAASADDVVAYVRRADIIGSRRRRDVDPFRGDESRRGRGRDADLRKRPPARAPGTTPSRARATGCSIGRWRTAICSTARPCC